MNKIRPKFHFWTKTEIKMCFCFVFVVSWPQVPFGSRFIDVVYCSGGEERVKNKTKTQGESFVFPFLSKNGI